MNFSYHPIDRDSTREERFRVLATSSLAEINGPLVEEQHAIRRDNIIAFVLTCAGFFLFAIALCFFAD